MTLANEIKYQLIVWVTSAMSLVTRVKMALGMMDIKYQIPGYFDYKGVPHCTFMHPQERMAAAERYNRFRPEDILLLTYPKAGTHFTRDIMTSIYKEKGIAPSHVALEARLPSLSMKNNSEDPLADLEAGASPRIIMAHWTWNMLPAQVKESKVKVVNCTRNPKDVLCSMFPFYSTVGVLAPGTTWENFVALFVEGNVMYGNYFQHVKEWYPNRNNPNLLNLQFEDMKKDLEGNVRKIARFLEIELTQEEVDRVVEANTFKNKKKEMGSKHPMYRQGKSGGWKSQLTVEQNAMVDEWIQTETERMDDLKIAFE